MDNIIQLLPKMKMGEELMDALSVFPKYAPSICCQCQSDRLIALSALYDIYIPSSMSVEVYSKMYLAVLHSLRKKGSKGIVAQYNENHRAILGQSHNGIIGGSDSFTIIGESGIGKSSAVNRAIALISENGLIETQSPYTTIIPCVVVQCPFDCSVKGLLLEILRKVDETIGSDYYTKSLKIRTTTDMLIGCVSQVAINHIGLLVVDEIQNVVNSNHGYSLVAMLTQLINNSGISICMVGTPQSTVFFEQAMQLARRSLGLQYHALPYGDDFCDFCRMMFAYQYTLKRTELTDAIVRWLYEHSGGVVSVVVSLLHDAQETAILNGTEKLNLAVLEEAYQRRLTLLHPYIAPSIKRGKQTSTLPKEKHPAVKSIPTADNTVYLSEIIVKAKDGGADVVEALKENITIEEIRI